MGAERSNSPHVEALLAEAAWVRNLARRLLRDGATADDVAQGALAAALESRPEVGDSLRPWLARVVGRLARRTRRTEGRRTWREARAAAEHRRSAPSSDALVARLEQQQAFAAAVRALPEPYRTVVLRRYYEGESIAEIARSTHTTPATVRSQLARGLERLRASLDSEHRDTMGALSALVLAAGSDAGWPSHLAAETIAMNAGTKIAVGLTVAAASLIAAAVWQGGHADGLHPKAPLHALSDESRVAGSDPLPGSAPSPASGIVMAERTSVHVTTAASPELSGSASEPTDAPLLTRITARVVDDARAALQGASILAVYADGRPRGSAPSPPSSGTGEVVLELRDDELRGNDDEIFAMTFAVSAADRATQFVSVTPRKHGETDLGTLVLAPGGTLVGTAVDPLGSPIADAIVLAAEPAAVSDVQAARLAGPDLGITRPRAVTAADGRFRVAGVALGDTRLWLHAAGCLWTIDRVLSVTGGGVTDVGQIVLERAPKDRRITGRVRQPSGAPANGAVVWYGATGRMDEAKVGTDAEGRFVIVPKASGTFEVLARAAKGEHAPSEVVSVPLGTEDLTLDLRARRAIAIHVEDPDGRPIAGAALAPLVDLESHFFVGGGRMQPGEGWTRTNEAGDAELLVPAETFSITASKRGYDSLRVGTYEPAQAPSELSIILRPEPAIEGVVLAYGEPVEGVKIQIGQRIEGFVPIESGFPLRFFINQSHGIRTNARGQFRCPVDAEWTEITVLASSDTHATGELQLRVDAGKGARDVEVVVTRGGAVEGSVLPPAGRAAEGLIVVASRGDGLPVWARADAEGRFRLERLAPGPWHVEGRLDAPTNDVMSFADTPEEKDFAWNVEVVDGETSKLDVDMRGMGDVELQCLVSIDGTPARGWFAELQPAAHESQRKPLPSVVLGPDGLLTMVAPAAKYYARLTGVLDGTLSAVVATELTAVGPRMDWSWDIRTGTFEEAFEAGVERARLTRGRYLEGRDSQSIELELDSARRVRAAIPVGRWSLQVLTTTDGVEGWKWLRSVEVE